MSRTVVVAGGSGFLGKAICRAFSEAGWTPAVLSRRPDSKSPWSQAAWDAKSPGPWGQSLEGAGAVVNLAGEPVSQKWTLQAQDSIRSSRIDATQAVARAVEQCQNPPKAWINASAIGYYGNRGDETLDEQSAPGDAGDFLVRTSLEWEAAVFDAKTPGTSRSVVRIGVVLGLGGGAFPTLLKLAKAFLGGSSGDGRQWVSWIHVDDLARLFVWIAERSLSGPVNGTAPEPVTNEALMASIRASVGRPWSPPVPALGLQLASLFGAPDPTLLLHSQRVLPKAALDGGFEFRFPTLQSALDDLVR